MPSSGSQCNLCQFKLSKHKVHQIQTPFRVGFSNTRLHQKMPSQGLIIAFLKLEQKSARRKEVYHIWTQPDTIKQELSRYDQTLEEGSMWPQWKGHQHKRSHLDTQSLVRLHYAIYSTTNSPLHLCTTCTNSLLEKLQDADHNVIDITKPRSLKHKKGKSESVKSN